jgi:chromosome segregation ATPase
MFESKELLRKVEYLEAEREKLWERLTRVEQKAKESATTHEKDAQQASKKAAEFKNKAEERKDQIEELHSQALNSIEQLKAILEGVKPLQADITSIKTEVDSSVEVINKNAELLEEKIENIDKILKEYPNLDNNLSVLSSQLESSQENSSKISTLLKGVTEKKNEIDELYFEIIGYEEKNEETGETEEVEGLKDKLENQYSELSKSIKDLRDDFNSLIQENTKKVDETITKWNEKYDTIIKRIETLLPNALTTGLSYAYSEKKAKEVENYASLKRQFNIGIGGLILISLLSVIISIYFIRMGTPFKEVIYILPSISAAIIPLYIPMLWFTFAAIKRVNLSKRLIEEYTHKEVISKTFEGLSTQISNLDDSPVSQELRLKLLFNLLEMSTENPGKLISDYKNSDHPVLEVLKQQTKLEQALGKAKDFPGVSKLNELVANSKIKEIEEKKEQLEKVIEDASKLVSK